MYKIIQTEKSWMESEAVNQLKSFSELNGILLAVGYPDLHPGKTPVGAAFISEGIIYPHLVGNDIGCSISLFQTSALEKKFKVDKVMKVLGEFSLESETPKAAFNLGTIGRGNHFAEFTTVEKIIDQEEFNNLNLDKKKVLLLVHSGSRALGEKLLRNYIEEYHCEKGLLEHSEGFNNYLKDYEEAMNFSRENRRIIAEKLCLEIKCGLEKLVIEAVHNGIEKNGEFYVHRKGAAPADKGCVVIAGSRGSSSYIVKPINSKLESGFSVAHGAGRKWQRSGCKERLENKFSKKSIRQGSLNYNIICKDTNLIYEEAPEAYKNIDMVINDLLEFDLIKVVAKLKPLITYKD